MDSRLTASLLTVVQSVRLHLEILPRFLNISLFKGSNMDHIRSKMSENMSIHSYAVYIEISKKTYIWEWREYLDEVLPTGVCLTETQLWVKT